MRGRNGINGARGTNGVHEAGGEHEASRGIAMVLPRGREMTLQHGIATRWRCRGTGLHSGVSSTLTLHPAAAGHGVVFTDGKRRLAAHWRHVRATHLHTVLGCDGFELGTVEHVLAALAGCGVDNVLVEVDGGEVPAMDGSALPFVEGIGEAGLVAQDAPRRYVALRRPVRVDGTGGAFMEAVPADVFDVTCSIDFPHPAIGRQTFSYRSSVEVFRDSIAGARTFGALADAESLRAVGLARGACEKNAIILGASGVLNGEGLRYPDEFVRHKLLDAIGDLSLAGAPLLAGLRLFRCGHGLHRAFLESLFAERDGWEWRNLEAPSVACAGDSLSSFGKAAAGRSQARAHEGHEGHGNRRGLSVQATSPLALP